MSQIFVRLVMASVLLAALSCTTEEVATEQDLTVVFSATHLREYGLTLPEGFERYESIARERSFDGTTRITYELTPPDSRPPVIHSISELHPSTSDACLAYNAMKFGVGFGGLEVVEHADYVYGEKSHFATIVNEGGGKVGNLFLMCGNGKVQFTMIVGLHFEDAETWAEAAGPVLAALDRYSSNRTSPPIGTERRISGPKTQ